MKTVSSKILLALAIISLLILGGVFIKGSIQDKKRPGADLKEVLGEQSSILQSAATDLASPINSKIQNSIDSAKNVVSGKTVEVEKMIITTLEKEVADFSKNQVDNLKLQICKDWGVILITPTQSPR
jgi:hypothetical protein